MRNEGLLLLQLTLTILTAESCFTKVLLNSVQGMAGWLLLIFFYMFTQSIKFYTFNYYVLRLQCLKNGIHQIDCKNEWLVLSARFTVKVGLVFVLTLENAFS